MVVVSNEYIWKSRRRGMPTGQESEGRTVRVIRRTMRAQRNRTENEEKGVVMQKVKVAGTREILGTSHA
jgi:hypothetical protein